MSNQSDVFNLIVAAQAFSAYSTYVIFAVSLIENVLNILVFTQLKIFRRNRCAFYFIIESFMDISQITQVFINEIWKRTLNEVEPMNVSPAWCKLRTMLTQWFRLMMASIVCFVAIDQFLSTNPVPYLRQLSSLRIARYQICFATCLCLLHTIPFGVFLQIQRSFGCIISSTGLIIYYSYFFYPILNGLLPIFVSSLFSILAYRNVRRIIRRQVPLDRRRLDQQLTAMTFVRVVFYVWLQLPFTIYRIYSVHWIIVQANTIQYAISQWIQVVCFALAYLNNSVNLYIFLATSMRYRRQVKCFLMKKCYQSLKQWCHGYPNTVEPLDGTLVESGTKPE